LANQLTRPIQTIAPEACSGTPGARGGEMPRTDIRSARPLEPLDRQKLQSRLETITRDEFTARTFDRLETRYLSGVAANYFLLLADVYDVPTIERILRREPNPAADLLHGLWQGRNPADDQAVASLRRVRAVPDEVRLIGEKCLYDVGLFGKRLHKGFELPELGVASYQRAAEILEELAQDPRLRTYFRVNRLGESEIEEEIIFLKQCARNFDDYAKVLSRLGLFQGPLAAGEPPRAASPEDATDTSTGAPRERDARREPPVGATRASALALPVEALQPAGCNALEPLELVEEEDPEIARLNQQEQLSYYERLLLFASLDIEAVRRELKGVVIDQPEAVDAICDDFSLYATGTHSRKKPLSYFFIGPTGVGKNHLVEQLVEGLGKIWGTEIPLLLIEGPSYTYPSDINELRGSTRGFIRSDEEGLLTEFHHRAAAAPFSVILVDEVEKAHPQLRKYFLSMMDRGTTTDNRGQQLNFASTMLVYTSNLGYSRLQQSSDPIGFGTTDARAEFQRRELLGDLKRELSPEFVNRLQIVHFNPLSQGSIDRIFDLELERIAARYRRFHHLEISVTKASRQALLARGYSPEYGARHLARVLNEICNVAISKKLRRDTSRDEAEDEASSLISYIQEARREERTADFEMLQRRVLARARARVPYRRVVVDHANGRFAYRTS